MESASGDRHVSISSHFPRGFNIPGAKPKKKPFDPSSRSIRAVVRSYRASSRKNPNNQPQTYTRGFSCGAAQLIGIPARFQAVGLSPDEP